MKSFGLKVISLVVSVSVLPQMGCYLRHSVLLICCLWQIRSSSGFLNHEVMILFLVITWKGKSLVNKKYLCKSQ